MACDGLDPVIPSHDTPYVSARPQHVQPCSPRFVTGGGQDFTMSTGSLFDKNADRSDGESEEGREERIKLRIIRIIKIAKRNEWDKVESKMTWHDVRLFHRGSQRCCVSARKATTGKLKGRLVI